jgi:hypothetical protein
MHIIRLNNERLRAADRWYRLNAGVGLNDQT